MTEKEKILFDLLKQKVAETFLKENTALSPHISQWKGDDIVRFQEDLRHKVKGRVSEKWFYNYFRNDIQKLPRIDMLNLLSQYAGYQNWADFMQQHSGFKQTGQSLKKWLPFGMLLLALIGLGFVWHTYSNKEVQFCLTDENNRLVNEVKVTWLLPNETEKQIPLKGNCLQLKAGLSQIQLRLESPYYKDIIITRNITENPYRENIVLKNDFIALLLQHYSDSDTQNWQKRRERLAALIAPDALIYQQWFGKQKGIELYEKEDFIAQMCVPNGLIRHIKILEIAYKNGQIVKLRFALKKDL